MSSFLDRVKKDAEGPKSKFAPSQDEEQHEVKKEQEESKDKITSLPPPFPVSHFGSSSGGQTFAPPPTGLATKTSLFGSIPKTGPSPFSPLEWNEFFDSREMIHDKTPLFLAGTKGPLFVCLHGAGHSALSFAALAKELKGTARIASFDFRGHGGSLVEDQYNHSAETLIKDTLEVMEFLSKKFPNVSIVLVGHSMGGSIATKAAEKIFLEKEAYPFHSQIKALFVIDVVEGVAIDALPFMESIIFAKPKSFKSLEAAIKWNVSSGNIKSTTSSRVSTPATLIPKDDGKGGKIYVWRTDLMKTKEYWEGWFLGLSKSFLNVPVRKQLVLAGTDRLDKELTIAQMQGKFKMEVVSDVGHVIQEDSPVKLAKQFLMFVSVFKIHQDADHVEVVTTMSGKPVIIGGTT